MKIFATSDIHGNRTIIDKIEHIASRADMIVICGDVGGKEFRRGDTLNDVSLRQKKDADHLVDRMKKLSVPFRFILGNDDWFEHDDEHHLKYTENISGHDLVPFELVPITPFNTNREANENKIRYELSKLTADRKSIIVAHAPPYRCTDTLYNGGHAGSRAARDWIIDVRPRIWLCGHIHEDHGAGLINDTLVLNCSCDHLNDELRGWIIDLDSLEYEKVIM